MSDNAELAQCIVSWFERQGLVPLLVALLQDSIEDSAVAARLADVTVCEGGGAGV